MKRMKRQARSRIAQPGNVSADELPGSSGEDTFSMSCAPVKDSATEEEAQHQSGPAEDRVMDQECPDPMATDEPADLGAADIDEVLIDDEWGIGKLLCVGEGARGAILRKCCSSDIPVIHNDVEPALGANATARESLLRLAEEAVHAEDPSRAVSGVMVAALPLLYGVLPRDQHGAGLTPHPHLMEKYTIPEELKGYTVTGVQVYQSSKACDNCDQHISDQHYWSCTEDCTVDFCVRCYDEMVALFQGRDLEHVNWVVQFITKLATAVLHGLSSPDRGSLVQRLAFDWPSVLFDHLVNAVVDVANASLVHVEDNCKILEGVEFLSLIHISEPTRLLSISYAVFCLKKKKKTQTRRE
eukprot:TRINITY_DN5579_c0_g1_i2.p1 TRINITY_DN5579_c0_g1~~TRINITY_DN5579_c0_g1_i2.p1  ORF type:complete len:356 (-),score=82.76 TRINITY_DN5579_c0_g1_i2:54-1121(-)